MTCGRTLGAKADISHRGSRDVVDHSQKNPHESRGRGGGGVVPESKMASVYYTLHFKIAIESKLFDITPVSFRHRQFNYCRCHVVRHCGLSAECVLLLGNQFNMYQKDIGEYTTIIAWYKFHSFLSTSCAVSKIILRAEVDTSTQCLTNVGPTS